MQGVFPKEQPLTRNTRGPRFGGGCGFHLAVAVLDIAQNRTAQIGQMCTDLVGAAGDKADLAQGNGPAVRSTSTSVMICLRRSSCDWWAWMLTLLFFSSCSHHAVNRPDCGIPTVMV